MSSTPPDTPAPKGIRPWRLGVLIAFMSALLVALLTQNTWLGYFEPVEVLDTVPSSSGGGRVTRNGPHVVLHLSGTPTEMGRQHGTLLRQTIREMLKLYLYGRGVISEDPENRRRIELLDAVHTLRVSLPKAFIEELDACAKAADVDPNFLLLAQCEGDLLAVASKDGAASQAACSAYVAFGAATAGGRMECGRNMDYSISEDMGRKCSLVTYYNPAEGYRFASVGLAGVLTGWTLINEHGLIVANHLGGGRATRRDGIPTLILARMVAQHAASVEEGIELMRKHPRMRGQIIWLAQEADSGTDRPARAVAAEYDAEKLVVREAEDGILIVTNTNRLFHEPLPEDDVACNRYGKLRSLVSERYGRMDGTDPLTGYSGVVNGATLHMVYALPSKHIFHVRHQVHSFRLGVRVEYEMPERTAR